ncbi:amidohydrolase family protein [Mangrovicoccus ximenensis]|uniref:amidohydrolase family protein n=1 Tax=Mangrovicoccus ximenensis TaxID=1911570 RepID=UPI000D33990C
MAECARFGITSVAMMDGSLYLADLLAEMAGAGDLPVRVSLPMTVAPDHDDARIAALIEAAGRPPVGRLSFGRIKMFMDGVFDTWTALRTDDYPGRPGFRSEPLFPPGRFAEICISADARGLQLQTHAVGDGAVRAVLDGYEAAQTANGPRDARHRVEHIDMLHPDDLPRLRELGATASMQPVHPPGSSGLPLEPTVSIMGRARWGDTFPWAAIAREGVALAFGTDWPTAPLSPFNAIHSALARLPWDDSVPDQRLPLLHAAGSASAAAGNRSNGPGGAPASRPSPDGCAAPPRRTGRADSAPGPRPRSAGSRRAPPCASSSPRDWPATGPEARRPPPGRPSADRPAAGSAAAPGSAPRAAPRPGP